MLHSTLAICLACSAPAERSVVGADARPDDPKLDLGRPTTPPLEDLGPVDSDRPDASAAQTAEWTRFQGPNLDIEGAWIATYDQNWWWDRAPRLHFAVFDGTRFQSFPNDRSFQFLASDRVDSVLEVEGRGPSYEDFLRETGLTLTRSPLPGQAHVLAAHEGYHREENGFGDFAWDLTRTDENGARFGSDGLSNEDYEVWGAPVLAPIGGTIIEIVRDEPDNTPGIIPVDAEQNYIGIGVRGRYAVYLLHFQQDSIPAELSVSSVVEPGDFLGLVGNSGVTLEPHVHVVLMFFDVDSNRYWSVPTEFDALRLHLGPSDPGTACSPCSPKAGAWVSDP
ncbi:MAG: hypothetical protein AAGD10_14355 [Myxococcota bacterium]